MEYNTMNAESPRQIDAPGDETRSEHLIVTLASTFDLLEARVGRLVRRAKLRISGHFSLLPSATRLAQQANHPVACG
jgi:hypothetical protein